MKSGGLAAQDAKPQRTSAIAAGNTSRGAWVSRYSTVAAV